MPKIKRVLFVMASAKNVAALSGEIAIPPAGMLSIAGYARQFFPAVEYMLRDFGAERPPLADQVEAVRRIDPQIIGMAARSFIYPATVELATAIKKVLPQVRIVFGGHHPTLMPQATEYPDCFDTTVRFEGEQAFVELMRMYTEGKPWPRKLSTDFLDEISHNYAWDMIKNPEIYARFYSPFNSDPMGSVVWSRGCPFDCFFCSGPAMWSGSRPRVRYRHPRSIVNELHSLHGLGVRRFFVHDDTLNTNLAKLEEILNAIIDDGIKMTWGLAGIRANLEMTPESLFPLLKKAGCRYVSFGIESGNQQVLDKLNRRVTLEEIERALELTKRQGMRPAGSFSIGHIWLNQDGSLGGETEADLAMTLDYMRKLFKKRMLWSFQFSVIDPVPGSPLWKAASSHDLLQFDNWDGLLKYDRVRLNFKHPFLSQSTVDACYKQAYRLGATPRQALYMLSTARSFKDIQGLVRTAAFVWRNRIHSQ